MRNAAFPQALHVGFTPDTSSVAPGVKNPIKIGAEVLFSEPYTLVNGTGLWRLDMYGSKKADGSGEQFQRFNQTLSQSLQDQPSDSLMQLKGARGEIDFYAIRCQYGYLCFDFMRGDNPSPDFTFVTVDPVDSSKLTTCKRTRPIGCPEDGGFFMLHLLNKHLLNLLPKQSFFKKLVPVRARIGEFLYICLYKTKSIVYQQGANMLINSKF